MEALGSLCAVKVQGLFGDPDRNLDLELDPDRPTVLTGGNGSGKSTILRLVKAVSDADIRTLLSTPVDEVRLEFDSAPAFCWSRRVQTEDVELSWGESSSTIDAAPAFSVDLPSWAVSALDDLDYPESRDTEEVLDLLLEAARTAGVPFAEFAETRDRVRRDGAPIAYPAVPDWFSQLASVFPVTFLTDQRLVLEPDSQIEKGGRSKPVRRKIAVEAASSDIARRMREVDSDYARESRNQDRSFPREVIAAMNRQDVITEQDLEELLEQVEHRTARLLDVGLLERTEVELDLAQGSLAQGSVRPVIETFLISTLNKLAVFDELEAKLREFKNFVNGRFSGKEMSLSAGAGLRFDTPDGGKIGPRQLSSGEQQMLVLAYEILFRAEPGTLVIVDEPEISLHVLWQDTLIENLIGMGAANGLQFLMATHSPVLLASHPELERSLDR